MARTRALPLPDAAVRRILSRVDDMRMTFPPSRGTRPFLAAFLRLVHEATGNVYGAGVNRKLLQLYAPEYRPSTVTLHDEIMAFREVLARRAHTEQDGQAEPLQSVDEPALLAGIHRMLAQDQGRTAPSQNDPFIQALQAENDRLRALNAQLEGGLADAQQERTRLIALAASLKSEAEAKGEALDMMTAKVEQLAQAVQAAQEQVAASHRFALGRVEDMGTESRQLRDQLRAANTKIEALQKRVVDEQAMTTALRQALSAQRSKV